MAEYFIAAVASSIVKEGFSNGLCGVLVATPNDKLGGPELKLVLF